MGIQDKKLDQGHPKRAPRQVWVNTFDSRESPLPNNYKGNNYDD